MRHTLISLSLCCATLVACSTSQSLTIETVDLTNPTCADNFGEIESLAKDVQVVALETNDTSLIRAIAKLTITDDRIIVFDEYNRKHQIAVFGRDGSWIASSRSGKGPGELSRVYCMAYDDVNDRIVAYQNSRISKFNKDLRLISDARCDLQMHDMEASRGEIIMKASDNQAKNQQRLDVRGRKIIVADTSFQTKHTFCPVWKNHEIHGLTALTKTKDGVVVTSNLCDTLFLYSNGEYTPSFVLDYSPKLNVPRDFTTDEVSKYLGSQSGIFFQGYYRQTADVQFLQLSNRKEGYRIFAYRNIATGKCAKLQMRGMVKSIFAFPETSYGDYFVTVLTHDNLEENLPTLRKVLSPEDLKKVEQMKEEDNPILIFYRIDI